jgi:hypothetical protein
MILRRVLAISLLLGATVSAFPLQTNDPKLKLIQPSPICPRHPDEPCSDTNWGYLTYDGWVHKWHCTCGDDVWVRVK